MGTLEINFFYGGARNNFFYGGARRRYGGGRRINPNGNLKPKPITNLPEKRKHNKKKGRSVQ